MFIDKQMINTLRRNGKQLLYYQHTLINVKILILFDSSLSDFIDIRYYDIMGIRFRRFPTDCSPAAHTAHFIGVSHCARAGS